MISCENHRWRWMAKSLSAARILAPSHLAVVGTARMKYDRWKYDTRSQNPSPHSNNGDDCDDKDEDDGGIAFIYVCFIYYI